MVAICEHGAGRVEAPIVAKMLTRSGGIVMDAGGLYTVRLEDLGNGGVMLSCVCNLMAFGRMMLALAYDQRVRGSDRGLA